MAGDIVSAGSFIAAVLEQAGYLTQGRFIEEFRSFFRDAGALVYFIGALGGLLSVVMFGSFRAAKYLIFGPALYWFLIGPVTEIRGSVAKLGGGTARGLSGDIGEAQALSDRDEVLKKAGFDNAPSIKVATGFWLFAKPINDFVQEFVDIMLKSEDGEDLMVAHKVRGIEVIARSMPENTDVIHILEEEILTHCSQSYAAALGVAESYIKERATQGISPATRSTNVDKYRAIRAENIEKFNNLAVKEQFNSIVAPKLSAHIEDQVQKGGNSIYAEKLYSKGHAVEVIKCGDAWNLFLEILWHESANSIPNILRLTSGEWQSEEAMQKACELLTSKMYDDGPALGSGAAQPCQIQPAVALALLSNHLSYTDTFGRVLKRHISNRDPLNPTSHSAIVAADTLATFSKENKKAIGQAVNAITTFGGSVGLMAGAGIQALGGVDKIVANIEWAPTAALNLIHGVSHSEQVGVPIYAMTLARKSLFSKAMDLPYYQGICLYYVAVFYPFAALLVLIPGKASAFLNVPLFWLWIKSWDIGFAALILLEKVMFNLLPNWSVARQLRTGPWDYKLLPIVLGEGFNFSHVQSVAQYYTVLAMATMAVPAIMGVIVLKGKKAILSSFIDGVEKRSSDSASREAGAYSQGAANERAAILANIKGFAKQLVIQSDGGVEGGLRGKIGSVYAAAAAISITPNALASSSGFNTVQKLLGAVNSSKAGAEKYLETYSSMVGMETKFESEQRAAFDPVVGRWGAIAQYADAYAAALDGAGTRLGGGFETNDAKANGIDDFIKLSTEKFKFALDIEKNVAETQGAAIGRIIKGKSNPVMDAALAAPVAKSIIENLEQNLKDNVPGSKEISSLLTNKLSSVVSGKNEPTTDMSPTGLLNLTATLMASDTFINSDSKEIPKSGYSKEAAWSRLESDSSMMLNANNNSYGVNAAEAYNESFGGTRQQIIGTREQIEKRLNSGDPNDIPRPVGHDNELSNALSTLPGIIPQGATSEMMVKEMQRKQDSIYQKENPAEYNDKLTQNLNYFYSTSGLNGEGKSNKERVNLMLTEVSEVQKKLSVEGKNLGYKLPDDINKYVETNPVWVSEVLGEWYRNSVTSIRDKTAVDANLKRANGKFGEKANIVHQASDIRGGN